MQFGYFDDEHKEYVITRPDTPTSWSNYLGDTTFGAVITNNAGGYGFYRSGARGRYLRLRFNSIPMDQPGRYFYIRDRDTGDYWSASWQPVGKPLSEYQSTCRHGTAYTTIESVYKGIRSESLYFIPLGQTFEYWRLTLKNEGPTPRRLSVFTYCEFTNQWITEQDQVNLQYSLFIVKGQREGAFLRISIHDNLNEQHPDNPGDAGMNAWMTLVGAPLAGFDTSRESFIGTYGSYQRPAALERGSCGNSEAYGDNACGSLQVELELAPGESKTLLVMLGIGDARTEGKKRYQEYGSLERCEQELGALKKVWHGRLGSMTVHTPDEDINHTVNVWGLYNCLITFAWSRAASLVYNGERDGLGFRDSVQDILGVVAAIPEMARERLELMLSGQLSNGGAIPVIKPFEHRPGHEKAPPAEEFRSDDCLWFFNAVPAYVAETGDFDFYKKVIPYADQGSDTVFGHLKRALLFNLERRGAHGIPCGLSADWNDCLRLGYRGESLFVAFQVRLGLTVYADIAHRLGEIQEEQWALEKRDEIDRAIQKHCWDGNWFIWAITENGTVYGTKDYEEGQVYLNTQVWAVISGAATPEQAEKAMATVKEKLATPYGLMLCAPPFRKTTVDVMRAVVFLQGIKENAGIFNHTQGWGIIAETLLGHGDQAYAYCKAALPAAYNDRAEIRQSEPYVQAQTTYSIYSPRPGNTRVSWLTGAAAWTYYSLTQYILGIRPEYEGLRIDPCIPSHWKGFTVERRFRGKNLTIRVENPQGVCKGVKEVYLNGTKLQDNLVRPELLGPTNEIVALMG
ncbi:glycosyl hydrolase family 65 protein [Treponema sp. J25]|uniref:GH36-type glycosyl hydrolase domain-containing protein n=1 Tax=Treponema sp. J25 TaxID=2094121 RepID=UPI0010485522|nr:glycosyl hydrolase family 65 protein [Treponema sp. J25]TCW60444.1 N,N'-diacetylchitobiose phosphorylase [Treponema sp. J25]